MHFSDIISFYGLGLEPMVDYISVITSHPNSFSRASRVNRAEERVFEFNCGLHEKPAR